MNACMHHCACVCVRVPFFFSRKSARIDAASCGRADERTVPLLAFSAAFILALWLFAPLPPPIWSLLCAHEDEGPPTLFLRHRSLRRHASRREKIHSSLQKKNFAVGFALGEARAKSPFCRVSPSPACAPSLHPRTIRRLGRRQGGHSLTPWATGWWRQCMQRERGIGSPKVLSDMYSVCLS